MIENIPTDGDIAALYDYADGKAQTYTGMSYADGIKAMLDWLEGNTDRPDKED